MPDFCTEKNIEGNKAATAPDNVVNAWISYRLPGAPQALRNFAGSVTFKF